MLGGAIAGLVLPWWWRWALLGVVVASSAAGGAYIAHVFDSHAYDLLDRQFAAFKSAVVTEGYTARQRARQQAANDQQRKEIADADLKTARAARDDALRGWVRLAESRAGGGYLPAPGPAAASPDRACVDRAEFERAMGALDRAGAAIAAAGDSCRVDLGAARRWAAGRGIDKPPQAGP